MAHNRCDTRVNVSCKRQMHSVVDDVEGEGNFWEGTEDGFDLQMPDGWKPPYKEIQDVLKPDYTVACIGRRGTGKSFMIRHIVYYMRHVIPRWYVFTNTKMNRYFMDEVGMPDKTVFPKLSIPTLRAIINKQKRRVEKVRKKIMEGDATKDDLEDLRVGVILDDIGSDKQLLRFSEEMDDIYYHGRHSLVFFIISEQYLKLVGPGARKNIDIPIMFCPDSDDEAREMIKQWLGFLPMKEARKMIWRSTRPEPILGEDGKPEVDEDTGKPKVRPVAITRDSRMTAKVGHPMETIFTTAAGDPPPYLSCCPEQWQECREDADQAYRYAQQAYLNRKGNKWQQRQLQAQADARKVLEENQPGHSEVKERSSHHVEASKPHRGRRGHQGQGRLHASAVHGANDAKQRRRGRPSK